MNFLTTREVIYYLLVLLIVIGSTVKAQTESTFLLQQKKGEKICLYYPFNSAQLQTNYLQNQQQLALLDSLFLTAGQVSSSDTLFIQGSSSPEGNVVYNQKLAAARAASLVQYLQNQYPQTQNYNLQVLPPANNLKLLAEQLQTDTQFPYREKLLKILKQVHIDEYAKLKQLKAVEGGKAWQALKKTYFAQLRTGVVLSMWLPSPSLPVTEPAIVETETLTPVPEPEEVLAPLEIVEAVTVQDHYYQRPLAIKTNLLFDVASVLNIGIEVPLSQKWSLAGTYTFPWWLWESKQRCLEVLAGEAELRYWLRNDYSRQEASLGTHNPLAGWFVGGYAGGGMYDVEWDKKGYQGEFFIALGLSGGYVKPLSKHFSLEFSLGVGFLKTNYRRYYAKQDALEDWHLVRKHSGNYTWIGPTKLNVSLLWYPHFLRKGGKP